MSDPKKGIKGGVEGVSFEIGASYLPIVNSPATNPAEAQVFACLWAYRREIVAAERKYGVTRIAIAGAIAWEMVENPMPSSLRGAGFGKVHSFTGKPWAWYDTLAKQAEDRGYIAKKSGIERVRMLETPEGAIEYIGAMMAAIADVAGQHGTRDIRYDPEILTNVYQSMTLKDWEKHLAGKGPGSPLSGGNKMDKWVVTHIDFLAAAVGQP